MTDPALLNGFDWVKVDPAPILGDSRPRTMSELMKKDPLWTQLYRDWLEAEQPDLVDGLTYVTESKPKVVEYRSQLSSAYKDFYKDAGELKDAVRKSPDSVSRKYPWAPPNAQSLVGTSRPSDFAALEKAGTGSAWATAYRGWLTAMPPFAGADQWFDWLLGQGDSLGQWERELDRKMGGFAEEVGRLKTRLSRQYGTSGERRMDRAADTARGAANSAAEMGRTALDSAAAAGRTASSVAASVLTTNQQPNPQATQPKPAQQPQGGAQKPAQQRPAARVVPGEARQQLVVANGLLTSAPQLSSWVDWLAGRFAAFGGTLAAEATSLRGYKGLIDRDTHFLAQQMAAASTSLTTSDDKTIMTGLAAVRTSVYRLAWDVDLGYQNYYGGWPHDRIGAVVQGLDAAGSPQVCYQAAGALSRLAVDVDSVYDTAAGLLDTALKVIQMKVTGYAEDDGAEAWGTHEVMGAKAQLSGISQMAAAWLAQEPVEEEDRDQLNQAAEASFGLPYENLLAVAGQ